MCVVHGNKKEEMIIFPHCLYIFFVSKDKKIKTKKEKKIYGKKGQLESIEERKELLQVSTPKQQQTKNFLKTKMARVWERKNEFFKNKNWGKYFVGASISIKI